MELQTYLHREGESRAQFAKRIGYHAVTVHKWATKKMFPRGRALRAIELATRGAVRANDFCLSGDAGDLVPAPDRQDVAA